MPGKLWNATALWEEHGLTAFLWGSVINWSDVHAIFFFTQARNCVARLSVFSASVFDIHSPM